MKYDFDTIISRRGTNSYKWDSAEDGWRIWIFVQHPLLSMPYKSGWRTVFSVIQKYPKPIMMRLSGGSMTGIAGRLIPGGLSIRVVSCRLCQPLSKPWPCRVIKSSFRLLPIIVSTHLSVMTDASCLPIISFIRMAAT